MQRWAKALLAGTVLGGAAYGIDAAVSVKMGHPRPWAMAAIPGVIAGASAGILTWLIARPAPGEGFPEGLGYYDWPDQQQPYWTYVEGINLPRVSMPAGTAGGMFTR